MAVKIDKEKCNGCGPCSEACPVEAIKIEDNLAVCDEDTCIDCGACIDACPNEAIAEG
jgi:NAD-dependent dihydropyrimidine dehydrogenase PreA subunit